MFFKTPLICVLLPLIFAVSHGQVVSKGACPDVKVIDNFKIDQYTGTWYEYSRYPVVFETDGKCITTNYSLQKDGVVIVENKMINEKNGEELQIKGYANQVTSGKLLVTFPVNPLLNTTANYWVLDTDYKNFSVVYSCKNVPTLINAVSAWILTRDRVPTDEVVKQAESVFVKNNILLEDLEKTDQVTCN